MKTLLVAGLFPDRQATFFETLCREFAVVAFDDCGFPRGDRFPFQPGENFAGGGARVPASEIAWQASELRAHAEATLADLLGRDCRLTREEFAALHAAAFTTLHAADRVRRLAAATSVDMVVTSADFDGARRPWVLAARELGIPTLCIEHGFWAPIPLPAIKKPELRRHVFYASDHVNLDNALEVEAALEAHRTVAPDTPAPEFLALGTPQDHVLDTTLERDASLAALGQSADRFTIVFLGSWTEARTPADLFDAPIRVSETYRALFRAFARWEHRDAAQLVIKLHPSFKPPELWSETSSFLRGLAAREHCPAPLILVDRLPEVLAGADVLVGHGFTSVFWDGFLRGCPSVVVPVPRYERYLLSADALERGNALLEHRQIRPAFSAEQVLARAAELMRPDERRTYLEANRALKDRYEIRAVPVEEKCRRICDWIRERLERPGAP